MKKLLLLTITLITLSACAQYSNSYKYPFYIGEQGTSTGSITLYGVTSGSALLRVSSVAGTGTIFQFPTNNGTSGYVLQTDGNGILSWVEQSGGISPLDTAAMLGNYINKVDTASMLLPYAKDVDVALKVNISDTVSMLTPYINRGDTTAMLTHYIERGDTASMLSHYAELSERYTNLASFVDETPWKLFYSDASGDLTEFTLGGDGTFFKSNGIFSAPTFTALHGEYLTVNTVTEPKLSVTNAPTDNYVLSYNEAGTNFTWVAAASGDVSKVNTPVDNQVGVWTGDGTIEGDEDLTFNGTTLSSTFSGNLTGNVTGNVSGSAATLATTRTIGGMDFNGSANITVASATGGFSVSGADLNLNGMNVDEVGVINLIEQASADADVASRGQIWVKTATPCELWFTDDAGTDVQLGTGGSGATEEEIEDYVGGMVTGNTETNITVTYQDGDGTLDFEVDVGDVVKILTDTSLYFAPVIGVGNANDTTLFSMSDVIWGAKWGGSHNLVITKVTGVVYGSSPDIDIALLSDVNFRDATPTTVLSSDLTITSTTTGNSATSFSNATIEPDDWLWIRIDQQTAQPTQCIINIYGYLTE